MKAVYIVMEKIRGSGVRTAMTPRITARVMLVNGPAMAVFPTIFRSTKPPAIITAPGEMILNSGEIMEISVMSAPHSVRRNSAQRR